MRIKICHVLSEVDHSYFIEAIEKFTDKDKYELSFVFMNAEVSKLFEKFSARGTQVEQIIYTKRKELLSAIRQLRKIFKKIKPDIVHTHLVDASLAGLIAARLTGIKKRVHTRHHSSECHTYYPHGVYYDKIVNRLSKRIMAITTVVEETLVKLENVDPEKVSLINYGYDFADFETNPKNTENLQQKYGLMNNSPVVGVISRFVHWKGVQYTVPAFAKVVEKYPNAKLVLASAHGSYAAEINSLLEKHLKPEQYVLIQFEPDVFNLYKTFDIFVHAPVNRDFEAFGQTYVEPLYLEIPSVFTISGIANDFIRDKENAIVVPYCDSDAIYESVRLLLEDDVLREKIISQGKSDMEARFHASRLIFDLNKFYAEIKD